jgi:hypothetical protein
VATDSRLIWPGGDGAGLVEHDGVDAAGRLEHLGPLMRIAELRAAAGADEQRRRVACRVRTAGDDEHRDAHVMAFAVEAPGSEPQPRPATDSASTTGTKPRRPVGQPLHGALPVWRGGDEAADLRERGVAADAGGLHDERPPTLTVAR